jgi:hypothetical protein
VEFPAWVPDALRQSAKRRVAQLDASLAQIVIDEWAGVIAAGVIHRSPLGYLQALVKRMQQGEFIPKYADQVAQARQAGVVTL